MYFFQSVGYTSGISLSFICLKKMSVFFIDFIYFATCKISESKWELHKSFIFLLFL